MDLQNTPTVSPPAVACTQPRVAILSPGPSAYDLHGIANIGGAGREAGRGYFVTRNFSAGEVVFSEEPLVLLPPNALAIERYVSFASCSSAARGLVLDMAIPAHNTDSRFVLQARASVKAALQTHPELESVGADLLEKVHLAWCFNAHSFRPTGTPAGDPPHSALFAIGSKVSINHLARKRGPSLLVVGLIDVSPQEKSVDTTPVNVPMPICPCTCVSRG